MEEEEEEEENTCDGAIYADTDRRSRCRPKGGYLRGMHINWGFLSGGGGNLGRNLLGLISMGVISGIPGKMPLLLFRSRPETYLFHKHFHHRFLNSTSL